VTFITGQQVASLNITINGDELPEDNEKINVKFSSSKLNQEVIATGTITNNDIVGTDADADISGTSEDDNISGGGIDKIDWWCRR
tara:strand:- start:360 stop:614 length:255 start_codon:yes stop_codon:yes gene_type:complete